MRSHDVHCCYRINSALLFPNEPNCSCQHNEISLENKGQQLLILFSLKFTVPSPLYRTAGTKPVATSSSSRVPFAKKRRVCEYANLLCIQLVFGCLQWGLYILKRDSSTRNAVALAVRNVHLDFNDLSPTTAKKESPSI